MKIIGNETLATIEKTKNGTYALTMYEMKYPVFTNEYSTMPAAKKAQALKIRQYEKQQYDRAAKSDTEKAMDAIDDIISFVIVSTKENHNYNAWNLAKDSLKIARDVIQGFEHVEFIPGEPNTKTGIKSIDLLPFVTCHKRCRTTCGAIKKGRKFNKGKCYAFKLMYRNARTCARWALNTALLMDRPTVFWEGVNRLMYSERFIRCFVAGDANIPGFFDGLMKAALANKHCKMQGFSKCYEVINAWIDKNGALPDNVKFLLSGWDGMEPINPHNLPVSGVYETELPEGWLSCGGNCLNCACVGLGCWKAENGDTVGLKKH